MPWRRLRSLIANLPRDSALSRTVHGADVVEWDLVVEQLSQIKTQLAWANWQRAGQKGAPKPKPDQRPGRPAPNVKRHGGRRTRSQAQIKKLLDSYSYRAPAPTGDVTSAAGAAVEEVT